MGHGRGHDREIPDLTQQPGLPFAGPQRVAGRPPAAEAVRVGSGLWPTCVPSAKKRTS